MSFLVRYAMIQVLVLKMTMVIFMSVYQESVDLFVQTSFVDSNTVRVFIATMRVIVNHENVSCLLVNAPQGAVMKYLGILGCPIMNGHVKKGDQDPLSLIQYVHPTILGILFVLKNMVRVILVNFLVKWTQTAILKHSAKVQNNPILMWDWDAFYHRLMGIHQRKYPLTEIGMKLYPGLLENCMVSLLLLVLLMVSRVGMVILV